MKNVIKVGALVLLLAGGSGSHGESINNSSKNFEGGVGRNIYCFGGRVGNGLAKSGGFERGLSKSEVNSFGGRQGNGFISYGFERGILHIL